MFVRRNSCFYWMVCFRNCHANAVRRIFFSRSFRKTWPSAYMAIEIVVYRINLTLSSTLLPIHSPSLTHSLMELSPSWEAANCAATRELSSILWNPEVHHRVHISPPPVPILSQIDPIPTIPSYLFKIHFNIVHPSTSWSSQCLFIPHWLKLIDGVERLGA
jgi:hypothetical protein